MIWVCVGRLQEDDSLKNTFHRKGGDFRQTNKPRITDNIERYCCGCQKEVGSLTGSLVEREGDGFSRKQDYGHFVDIAVPDVRLARSLLVMCRLRT